MERTDGSKNEQTMRIRMSTALLKRIQASKVPSGWGEEADSSFARYLIILGLEEVEFNNKERLAKREEKVHNIEEIGKDNKQAI